MQKTDEKKREKVNGIKIPSMPGTSNVISCGLHFEKPPVMPCAASEGQRGSPERRVETWRPGRHLTCFCSRHIHRGHVRWFSARWNWAPWACSTHPVPTRLWHTSCYGRRGTQWGRSSRPGRWLPCGLVQTTSKAVSGTRRNGFKVNLGGSQSDLLQVSRKKTYIISC